LDAYKNYRNHFILVKNSLLEISWKRSNTKLLAKGISSHLQLYHKIHQQIIEDPKQMPDWLTTGITTSRAEKFKYRNSVNMEHEMFYHTSNH
jgi:hypothetical protein